MKKINIYLMLIIQILFSWVIFANDNIAPDTIPESFDSYTLTKIDVIGLTKTKYKTVLKICNLENGQIVDITIEEKVKQDLLTAGIFRNDIKVKLEPISDSEATLKIELEDRWTLIPLPVGFVTSDTWLVGGVFIESNLAGLNQAVVSGFFWGSDSKLGFASWSNPNFLDSGLRLSLSGSFNIGIEEYLETSSDSSIGSHDQTKISFNTGVSDKLDTGISWSYSTGLSSLAFKDSTGYLEDSDFSDLLIVNNLGLSWDNLFYEGFFKKGWYSKLSLETDYMLESEKLNTSVSAEIYRNIIFDKKHTLKIQLNGGYYSGSDSTPILIGGAQGSRALSSGEIAVNKYTSGLVSFEPVLFNPSWGVFTLPIYYEGGLLTSVLNNDSYWHGPGIGFRFYVDKVSIPALGADITWDLERNTYEFSVSVGGTGGG